MQGVILTPTDFVALVNQTLEFAYPAVAIEGELCNFRVAKNRWVYFALKDDVSVVQFFGTVYQLPGPLEDGLSIRVLGSPRLHAKFGFSVNVISMAPVGEGSIKKTADLLAAKLAAEGLFALERKRPLLRAPETIGLITAGNSAAYADFIKIMGERWGGVEILFADVYVQGDQAPLQIVKAIEHMNQRAKPPEVLVITRGGGSAEDLAAFNDERVVRSVAASRIPVVVAIGHEVDESLAELAADQRASTPSNAAQIVVPDRGHELANLGIKRTGLYGELLDMYDAQVSKVQQNREVLAAKILNVLDIEDERLTTSRRLAALFNPEAALRRGYAIVRKQGRIVTKKSQLKVSDELEVGLSDGKIKVNVKEK
ncbi:MAG TPA: exodeoxyribonuclease VII large subunit [Candidatus Saccharimonadales bacterium]|nr:exodeoxyribonuclease VII large subunit [Candidatus Saccharimonadales bacterium]